MVDIRPPNLQTEDQFRSLHGPYLPPGPPALVFEKFQGINTSTSRPGVTDEAMYWCDSWMPIGPRFLRTMYDIGDPITFEDGAGVSFFGFVNIGAVPYCIVIHNDGSLHAVNTDTYTQSQIGPAGTIINPSRLNVGLSQYGSLYLILVSAQENGYFLWDGTLLYQAGSLGPVVTVTDGGSGYSSAPSVSASGGSGSGATFEATVANGIVTEITVTNPGSGYLAGETVTLSITGGGGSGATATVELMPYAISGTSVETYAGHVWVGDGDSISYTAPGSVSDFSTANGGGNFTSTDSFLRVRYIQLLQTNGFLYLIADSSVNYISGVTTSGSPPVTTFTNQNADPETGSPWPSAVTTFSRNIVFANAFGAHVSYGAAVTKISEALDGVYNTVDNFAGLIPSCAKAILFGKRCWILLLPIIDPVSNQQTNKMFLWNGKIWWAAHQSVELSYIQSQEIDSVFTAWGTDGVSIYPLFQNASTDLQKIVQSRFWDTPVGYQMSKTTDRVWTMNRIYSFDDEPLQISIDTEISSASNYKDFDLLPPEMTWINNADEPIVWKNNSNETITWYSSGEGLVLTQPEEFAQNGVLLGLTLATNKADMALISAMIPAEPYNYRG